MAQAPTGSRFRIKPNPPQVGQSLEITYIGPATEIEIQIDDRDPVRLRPDENGRIRVEPLPAGEEFVLSDNQGLPGYLYSPMVEIESKRGGK
ncbi:MAG: hypothetical protein ACYTG5_00865 [Planctomycetota bacterium]|jgi:hypothetical protein